MLSGVARRASGPPVPPRTGNFQDEILITIGVARRCQIGAPKDQRADPLALTGGSTGHVTDTLIVRTLLTWVGLIFPERSAAVMLNK